MLQPLRLSPGCLTAVLIAYPLCLLALMAAVLLPGFNIPLASLLVSALSMLDYVIHEGGHLVFIALGGIAGSPEQPLPQFIGVMGGTLGQLLVPLLFFMASFFNKRDRLSTPFFLLWLGQNYINISPYIADARRMALPLVSPWMLFGVSNVIHDWNFMLGKLGLLWADQIIAGIAYLTGVEMMTLAVVLPLVYATYMQDATMQSRLSKGQ